MQQPQASRTALSACPNCSAPGAASLFRKQFKGRDWYLARCGSCDQHFTDPLPTLDDIKGFYGDEYHVGLCHDGPEQDQFLRKFRRYADWICSHVPAGGRSLDIGCTVGLFPVVLRERGFDAEGLEINHATAAWGRERFGLRICNEPFETVVYPKQAFRLVSLADVLEHSLDPYKTLVRVNDIVEDGGYVFVSFPDIESLESRYFRMLAKVTGRGWLWDCCHVPLHTWEFTRATAEALFRKGGFTTVAFRRAHLPNLEGAPSFPLAIVSAPPRVLGLPALGWRFGTQMEFLLRKQQSVGVC